MIGIKNFANWRFGIIEVAEYSRTHRTVGYTGWCCLGIHARCQTLCQSAVDGLDAKRTFFHHASRPSFNLWFSPFWNGGVLPGKFSPVK